MPKAPVVEAPKEEEVEFDMECVAMCPECATAGNPDVPTGFAYKYGGFVCFKALHHFDAAPDVPQTAATPSQVETVAPQASQEAPGITISGFEVKTDAGGVGKVDGPTMQQIKDRMAELTQQTMRERARKPVEVEKLVAARMPAGTYRKGDVIDMPAEVSQSLARPVEVADLKPAGGGDLLVTLRLNEPNAQAILAEAETQRQTPEEYLTEWLNTAISNYWGR